MADFHLAIQTFAYRVKALGRLLHVMQFVFCDHFYVNLVIFGQCSSVKDGAIHI